MMDANRKHWNEQHAVLHRLLMKEKNFKKALPVLLEQHAAVHSAKLPPLREDKRAGARWSFQDEVLSALNEAQMRALPKGKQPVVWKLWHIARVEDITMNLLLAGSPQVFRSGNWLEKMAVDFEDVGNDMPASDLIQMSERLNVKALLAYRLAVGRRTRSILRRLKPDALWEPPAANRIRRIIEERAVRETAGWLLKYWGGNPGANLLLMPATRHPFVHLNEISRMLPKLRDRKKA
jgi:hypothetical protein